MPLYFALFDSSYFYTDHSKRCFRYCRLLLHSVSLETAREGHDKLTNTNLLKTRYTYDGDGNLQLFQNLTPLILCKTA
jgi:hypothetical protein